MRVLWGLTSKNLWIELTVENMTFMKNLVASGQKQLKPRKRASPKKKLRNVESGAFCEAPATDGRGTVSSVQVRCLCGKGAHICVPGQAYGGQQPAIGCWVDRSAKLCASVIRNGEYLRWHAFLVFRYVLRAWRFLLEARAKASL